MDLGAGDHSNADVRTDLFAEMGIFDDRPFRARDFVLVEAPVLLPRWPEGRVNPDAAPVMPDEKHLAPTLIAGGRPATAIAGVCPVMVSNIIMETTAAGRMNRRQSTIHVTEIDLFSALVAVGHRILHPTR